jgi:enterochelin esterase-like enzyme
VYVPLLGAPLLVLTGVLLIAATVLAFAMWRRVRGPAAVRVAQRLGMLVGTQLLAVLLAAVAVNNYAYFYVSWSDLFGPGQQTATVQSAGGGPGRYLAPVSAFPSTATPLTSWSTASQYATRGSVRALQIRGARTGITTRALVYLPPQYFQPQYQHATFPGVEILSGYPGSTIGLLNRMAAPAQLLARMRAHRAEPMVLVMMMSAPVPPRDTECTNVPHGPQVETFFASDVPTAVESTFRVRALGWGTMGDSTGGYCATKIAMDHADIFSAAVSLSGYYHAISDATTGTLWGGSAIVKGLNDPEWRLQNLPAPPVAVLATIGTAEGGPNGVSDTKRFLSLVRAPMVASAIYVKGGGHNYADWGQAVPRGLSWLSQYLH